MRSYLTLLGSLLLVLSGIATGDTPMERILSSMEAGEISGTEAAELLVQSVTDYDNLPSLYTDGTDAARCGTPALLEAMRLTGETDSPLANRPVLTGPEYTIDSPSGHFKIHWTDSGADATNSSYANTVVLAADSAWAVQCDDMGFIHPPPDMGVGGDDKYDMYICYLGGGVLGYTTCNGEYHPPDSTHSCSASHVVIGSNITASGTRVCTVAHEFQHAIQMSYDYNEPTWFMENCAVWMEEMVYPTVNDYLMYISYGENPIRYPWMDIRSGSMYWYGAFTWPWMMWDRWGYESVRSIWEYCAAQVGNTMLAAHDDMFADHGMTFEEFFMDYGCWRWFTAGNWYAGCGMYNPEVVLWNPGPRVLPYHEVTSLPFTGDQTTNYEPDTWGIHWVRVNLTNYQNDWIEMSFDGRDGFEWNMGVIMQDLSGRHYFEWYDCDPTTGNLDVTVGACGWDYAIFFPALISTSPLDHLYEISISSLGTGIEGSPDVTDQLNLSVSSNPMTAGGSVTFNMPEAGNAQLQVYDMSGRVAATLLDDDIQAGQHSVQFQGTDLSNGTYFIMLFADDRMSSQKVVLAR
ncbi:MAG: T9SS type A sorting domain-containing protein [Candidatus Fermentibacteraceae bacterium]|nr:T9SS type A sorting domain-containing protein [Candidatus Fermentibacteraceae bacterium]MBN2608005.1 T9SS type A sorting domain-containing protein [Candidatus Fermentibacteraceae bacterium]